MAGLIKEARLEENQTRIDELCDKYRCKRDDAMVLVELEEVIELVITFFTETLDMDKSPTTENYSASVNIKEFVERRLSILLRLTNVQNLLMTAHPEARSIWDEYIRGILMKFKDLPMSGAKIKAFDVHTDLMMFKQEMRNFIERGDVARLMALKGHTLPDPDKIYSQAIKSIGSSHQAKWVYRLLVQFGRGNPMTAKQLSVLSGYNEDTLADALNELREKGSQILECGYGQPTGGKPPYTYWIPDVFRERYVGDE